MQDMFDEHQYFFVHLEETPNDERSEVLARGFCSAYHRKYNTVAEFVGSEVDGLDAIVRVKGREIVLEFCAYMQRDLFHEQEVLDSNVKTELSMTLGQRRLPRFGISIKWKEEERKNRSNGASSKIARLPRGRAITEFTHDFLSLVRFVMEDRRFLNRYTYFRTPDSPEILSGHGVLRSCDFPVLDKYCASVRIDEWNHTFRPEIRTSTKARNLGLDQVQLSKTVSDHAAKIANYRLQAEGRPICLVVHADGFPTSRRIHPLHRSRALAIVRDEASSSFDGVFWAETLVSPDGAKLYEVG